MAAGSVSTAEVGGGILQQGGTAADAAVAMVLASCAAETVFTGLSGGGFATHYEAVHRRDPLSRLLRRGPWARPVRCIGPPQEVLIDFGGQVVPYAVGPGTVAVPGVPAGVAALHDRWGRLAWRDLVEPARRLADVGVPFGEQQAKVLTTVADAMLLGDGTAAYAPDGVVLDGQATLHHPGLAHAFEVLRDEGAAAFYSGRVADALLATLGGSQRAQPGRSRRLPGEGVDAARGRAGRLPGARRGATTSTTCLGVLAGLDLSGDDAETACRLVEALRANPRRGDTTSVAAADADGNLCAATTSLGLSSGVWLSEFGMHLNSMMGEGELLRGELVPGERMGSMMTPLVMHDDDGPRLVAGAAGGSRIRSALAQVLVRVVRELDAGGRGDRRAPPQPGAGEGPHRARLPGVRRGGAGAARRGGEMADARLVLRRRRGDRPARTGRRPASRRGHSRALWRRLLGCPHVVPAPLVAQTSAIIPCQHRHRPDRGGCGRRRRRRHRRHRPPGRGLVAGPARAVQRAAPEADSVVAASGRSHHHLAGQHATARDDAVEPAGTELLRSRRPLPAKPQQFAKPPSKSLAENATWRATIKTNCGTIVIDLDGKAAPQTVSSFIFLSQKNFFDDVPCHRLDHLGPVRPPVRRPDRQRQRRPGLRLRHRERAQGRRLPQPAPSPWRAPADPNSNGSQFFIVYDDTTLPTDGGGYSIFGKVVEGLDIVQAVAAQGLATDGTAPKQPMSMLSISVDKL